MHRCLGHGLTLVGHRHWTCYVPVGGEVLPISLPTQTRQHGDLFSLTNPVQLNFLVWLLFWSPKTSKRKYLKNTFFYNFWFPFRKCESTLVWFSLVDVLSKSLPLHDFSVTVVILSETRFLLWPSRTIDATFSVDLQRSSTENHKPAQPKPQQPILNEFNELNLKTLSNFHSNKATVKMWN